MSQCVCARSPHKRVCGISLSLSLSLSLFLSLSLSMHAPAGGIDNHKVRGDKEHGPQAAGVRVRSVPAAIGSQHALARCQQTARDFVAADSQKFQAAAEGDRGLRRRKPIFVRVLGSTIWYSTVARLVHRRCWLDLRSSTNRTCLGPNPAWQAPRQAPPLPCRSRCSWSMTVMACSTAGRSSCRAARRPPRQAGPRPPTWRGSAL